MLKYLFAIMLSLPFISNSQVRVEFGEYEIKKIGSSTNWRNKTREFVIITLIDSSQVPLIIVSPKQDCGGCEKIKKNKVYNLELKLVFEESEFVPMFPTKFDRIIVEDKPIKVFYNPGKHGGIFTSVQLRGYYIVQ